MSLPTKIHWSDEPWKVINDENWRTFIDLASNMAYNGIAYEIKRLAQRVLLVGKNLAKSMHQDVDTSWWQIGGNTTSWMNGICRLLIYSLIFHVCYNVPQMFLHYITVSIPHCHVDEYWRALDYPLIQGEHFYHTLHQNKAHHKYSEGYRLCKRF